jgi:hypothetical protein
MRLAEQSVLTCARQMKLKSQRPPKHYLSSVGGRHSAASVVTAVDLSFVPRTTNR